MEEEREADGERRAESGWVEFIRKIDDNKGDGRTFNLMSLGLIALEMVSPHFKVENFRLVRDGREELDWMRFRQAIKTLKNDELREKIWILTSEYPNERLDVFESLNSNFSNFNYPRDLLLRGTSFAEDLNFMRQLKQRSKAFNAQSVESLALTHLTESKLEYSNAVPNYTFQSFREDINDRRRRNPIF
jgi:hypothetical protein